MAVLQLQTLQYAIFEHSCSRKVEDKFAEHGVELKSFCLNLDTSSLHGNRDTPAVFNCWLGVLDHTLPTKGTLHRASRATVTVDKDGTNSPLGLDSASLVA